MADQEHAQAPASKSRGGPPSIRSTGSAGGRSPVTVATAVAQPPSATPVVALAVILLALAVGSVFAVSFFLYRRSRSGRR
jgi:hypothetical protein